MSVKLFEKFFKNLGKGYQKPNAGGCGLFALAASNALSKAGVKHKIFVNCRSYWQYDEFIQAYGKIKRSVTPHYRQLLDQGRQNGIHNHITIEIDGIWFDAEGICDQDYDYSHTIDRRTLQRLVKDKYNWNSTFRSNNAQADIKIPVVKKKALHLADKIICNNRK